MMNFLNPEWLTTSPNKKWLIAISGGRDSVALLHACATDKILIDSGSLFICHVNHQLRGADSDADEALVRNLAEHYDLPISVYKMDVSQRAVLEKKSIELAAREARHEAFSVACEEYGCCGVLLAHHADDQAETVLYNLLRGSAGLKGIQQEIFLTELNLRLVRPILHVRRSAINTYISDHQLTYREDGTNAEAVAVRNRLRNEAIPLLKDILERDVAIPLIKSLHYAEENEQFIQQMIDYESILDPQGRLYLPSLIKLPQILQKRIIHRFLSDHKISNLSQDLIVICLQLLDVNNPAKLNLPQGKYLRRKEQRIFVSVE